VSGHFACNSLPSCRLIKPVDRNNLNSMNGGGDTLTEAKFVAIETTDLSQDSKSFVSFRLQFLAILCAPRIET